ncbi:TetR/AcrR family transcriptional regulator [Pseudodonghicola xiamenensis]|uniref:HTH tetR-type domain-containing protein n=1 Tax=Pseudodonghicola xiamenensis TaxID=337702 RepID=A0A8J3MCD1_9RHOB|nr:TetR/AcrR family transcriptional regulator [Pseudodonghicola xiamenensis]GHG90835.1 hypothetical protein GCM10010961_21830 [Pseudodonghicola xiamenensis]
MANDSKPPAYVRKDERREMIAEAARRLIAEKGLAALRTRDVAERVGINISTLHFHVRSKAALLTLVAETSRDAFLALLPPDPSPDRDALAQLRAEVQAFHDSLRDRPELARCFGQLAQLAETDAGIAATLEDFTRGWAGRYAAIIGFGRDQGLFRADVDPYPAALMATGALTAFAPRGPGGLAQFWPVYQEIERGLQVRHVEETDDAS